MPVKDICGGRTGDFGAFLLGAPHEYAKTEETLKNKTIKKTDSRNEGKTTSITYDVTTFNQLNSSLTSMDYDTVTLNINSNIDLENNITVCGDIKILTINGNDKTINGQNQYQFLYTFLLYA